MRELFTQFGISWSLLLAQVVNFGILIFLLSRYAYRPVIKMLDARRQKIQEGLEATEQAKKKLAETEESEKNILLAAEEKALGIVTEAEQAAKKQGSEIVDSARAKGEQVILSGRKVLESEKNRIEEEIVSGAQQMIKVSLAKVLAKKEPDERDDILIQAALKELSKITT